jgi:hypothetical protein
LITSDRVAVPCLEVGQIDGPHLIEIRDPAPLAFGLL